MKKRVEGVAQGIAVEDAGNGTYDDFSSRDILSVVSGLADRQAARHLLARAVSDHVLRERIALSLPPEDEETEIADAVSEPSAVSDRMSTRVRLMTSRYATARADVAAANPLLARILTVLDGLLTLPVFAPAFAAPDSFGDFSLRTQTLTTAEGVRVEFHQFPSDSGPQPTLRVIVDASVLGASHRSAVVTISGQDEPSFLLIVVLNPGGSGFTDVTDLPPSRSARWLSGVTLSPG